MSKVRYKPQIVGLINDIRRCTNISLLVKILVLGGELL